jgi:rare lipoprotein A (peptidoglycan hydrolase)
MDTGEWILSCMSEKKVKTPSLWWMALLIAIWVAAFFLMVTASYAFETETSYFTYESCRKEGTSGICANGQRLVDTDLVAASWDFPLNSYIRVTSASGRSVICKVADRGPAKRLYRKGRRLDLSAAAFKALAGGKLDRGILQVTVVAI